MSSLLTQNSGCRSPWTSSSTILGRRARTPLIQHKQWWVPLTFQGSPTPPGYHTSHLPWKSHPSFGHAVSLLHLLLPLWVKWRTHVLAGSPMAGWQEQGPFPVYPEVQQNKKPLTTTYTKATIFENVIPHRFSCCSVIRWLPFFEPIISM